MNHPTLKLVPKYDENRYTLGDLPKLAFYREDGTIEVWPDCLPGYKPTLQVESEGLPE